MSDCLHMGGTKHVPNERRWRSWHATVDRPEHVRFWGGPLDGPLEDRRLDPRRPIVIAMEPLPPAQQISGGDPIPINFELPAVAIYERCISFGTPFYRLKEDFLCDVCPPRVCLTCGGTGVY